jgi:hypothetical protein
MGMRGGWRLCNCVGSRRRAPGRVEERELVAQTCQPSPLAGDPGSRLRAMLPSQNRELGHTATSGILACFVNQNWKLLLRTEQLMSKQLRVSVMLVFGLLVSANTYAQKCVGSTGPGGACSTGPGGGLSTGPGGGRSTGPGGGLSTGPGGGRSTGPGGGLSTGPGGGLSTGPGGGLSTGPGGGRSTGPGGGLSTGPGGGCSTGPGKSPDKWNRPNPACK